MFDTEGVEDGTGMRGMPDRVAATSVRAGDIDDVLHCEAKTAERAVFSWRDCELLDEGAGFFR